LLVAFTTSALACGDRFLVTGSPPTVGQVFRPSGPVEVLIYGGSESAAVAAVTRKGAREALESVSERISFCTDPASCIETMNASGRDVIVLADARDADRVQSELAGNPHVISVIPFVDKGSRDLRSDARARFGIVLDSGTGSVKLASTICQMSSSSKAN